MVKLSPRLARFAAAFAAATGLPAPAEDNANYAQLCQIPLPNILHFPSSKERSDELDIIRWCYAVAGIAADSPRFAYYVSRWDVPGKIAKTKASGTFDTIISNCPPINPAWVRFVPAALTEWEAFQTRAKLRPADSA